VYRFAGVRGIAHDQPAYHVHLVAMQIVNGLECGIAGGLTLLSGTILGAGAQELEIVFQDVLDAEKYVLEAGLPHPRGQGLAMISDRRSHTLDEVLDVVQAGLDDGPAQGFEALGIEGNVVVHQEDGFGAMIPRIADVGQNTIKRIGMEVAPTHGDYRAKAAIEGTAARGFDYVHLLSEHGIAAEDSRVAPGKPNLAAIEIVNWTRRVVMPTVPFPIDQAGDGIETPAVFQCPYQFAKRYFALAAHNEVHS